MPNRFKLAAVATVALALATSAHAQDVTDSSTIVARVNGTDITIGHMILTRNDLPTQYRQLPDEVLFPALLDQLIQQTLLGSDAEGPMPTRVKLQLENEERSLMASIAIEQMLQSEISDEDIQAAYEERYAGQDLGLEYNASHILLDTEEEALALLEELQGGADFATAAQEHSTGPSGPSGGSLGWFGRGAMVEPFDAAVAAMEVGTLAGPVQTQFGWHFIRLNETRQIEAPALEEVQNDILDQLGSIAIENKIASLLESADVERMPIEGINPSILQDVTLLED